MEKKIVMPKLDKEILDKMPLHLRRVYSIIEEIRAEREGEKCQTTSANA